MRHTGHCTATAGAALDVDHERRLNTTHARPGKSGNRTRLSAALRTCLMRLPDALTSIPVVSERVTVPKAAPRSPVSTWCDRDRVASSRPRRFDRVSRSTSGPASAPTGAGPSPRAMRVRVHTSTPAVRRREPDCPTAGRVPIRVCESSRQCAPVPVRRILPGTYRPLCMLSAAFERTHGIAATDSFPDSNSGFGLRGRI